MININRNIEISISPVGINDLTTYSGSVISWNDYALKIE